MDIKDIHNNTFHIENGAICSALITADTVVIPYVVDTINSTWQIEYIGKTRIVHRQSCKAKNIIFEGVVKTLGSRCFQGAHLRHCILPEGMEAIGHCAFINCLYLRSIVIPSSVKHIDTGVFCGCVNLEYIYIDKDNPYYRDVDGVVFTKDMSQLLYYPAGKKECSYAVPNGVNIIKGAFKDSCHLETVTLPLSIEVIDDYSFDECKKLTEINIPKNVLSYGYRSMPWWQLTKLTVDSTWNACSFFEKEKLYKLKEFRILNSDCIIDLSKYFSKGLNNLIVSVPSAVMEQYIQQKVINHSCFVSLNTPGEKEEDDIYNEYLQFDSSGKVLLKCNEAAMGTINIPAGTECISSCAFWGCKNVTGINIPNSITRIENMAFSATGIKQIMLPNSISYIGEGVFENCIELEYVNMSYNTRDIMNCTFAGCLNLKRVYPFENLRSIGEFAFFNCSSLEVYTDAPYLLSVGERAFENCKAMKRFVAPRIEVLGSNAFKGCDNIEIVNLSHPNYKVGEGVFRGCKKLRQVEMPHGISNICDFADCESLEHLSIPNSIKNISGEDFISCKLKKLDIPTSTIRFNDGFLCSGKSIVAIVDSSKTEINVPYGIECIGEAAFLQRKNLCCVKLPDTVKSIKEYAFCNCAELKKLELSPNIENIGISAFAGCDSLSSIIVKNDYLLSINTDIFADINKEECVMIVPKGKIQDFKRHHIYGNIKNIKEGQ